MKNLNNPKYLTISSQEMAKIKGGKKVLNFIECKKDCETGAITTLRWYDHYNLKGEYTGQSTSKDKKDDVAGCII